MRKVLSVVLHVIAGFFFYMVSVLGFANEPAMSAKWWVMGGFTVPALLALGGGVALGRFRNWKRDVGIVLLCASGVTALVGFTFVCLLLDDEFRKMMQPDTLKFFSDYVTGIAGIVMYAGLGWFLLKANKGKVDGTPSRHAH